MNIFRRIWLVFSSLVSILLSIILMIFPTNGCYVALGILGTYLLFYGVRKLVYYFTMARFKVGGNTTLYVAVVCLDLAVTTFFMVRVPPQMVMIYLLFYYVFYGMLHIYSAVEARRIKSSAWRLRLVSGIICLLICVLCVLNFSSEKMVMYILCSGFIYSAVLQIINACRRTTVIYIA